MKQNILQYIHYDEKDVKSKYLIPTNQNPTFIMDLLLYLSKLVILSHYLWT